MIRLVQRRPFSVVWVWWKDYDDMPFHVWCFSRAHDDEALFWRIFGLEVYYAHS